ncbi:YciI family protein [Tianweitania sediminis]|uniref:YCII-related domain-containing protein n=1 Tax=Tianweitania sediminis TaxID=1502156 RepID=A0A8J7RF84_9HYPH|nr:YciI family protein [Tianweitania sediminis]MBP0437351.1 hypothetical protein [Tianweitania sediminis]
MKKELPMIFVCPSEYLKEITADALDAHRSWLRAAVSSADVISAGRRDPATGGVIVLRAADAASAHRFLEGDPFTSGGFARYDCIGYNPTMGDLQG